ncbi:hypothetical protein Tco_0908829 [Tanacetum coccineum]|uniref:Uncharacterized protein n=1 Tax=Tanacetum coccineum TaxID=301880 RepID=A0ABQ5CUS1_9ASTR
MLSLSFAYATSWTTVHSRATGIRLLPSLPESWLSSPSALYASVLLCTSKPLELSICQYYGVLCDSYAKRHDCLEHKQEFSESLLITRANTPYSSRPSTYPKDLMELKDHCSNFEEYAVVHINDMPYIISFVNKRRPNYFTSIRRYPIKKRYGVFRCLNFTINIDDPNITMKEYIRLKEEKARRRGKVYNWETATYGKIWYDEDGLRLRSVVTEFSSIIYDGLDLHLNTYVSYFDDLDFFKDFENEFPAIVYNDALTSKSDSSTEPVEIPHRINEFDFNLKLSLLDCVDNDDDKIDIKQSSKDMSIIPLPNVIHNDDGAYAHGSNKLFGIRS